MTEDAGLEESDAKTTLLGLLNQETQTMVNTQLMNL